MAQYSRYWHYIAWPASIHCINEFAMRQNADTNHSAALLLPTYFHCRRTRDTDLNNKNFIKMKELNKNPDTGPRTDKSASMANDFFLPDFCNVQMVFAVILIAELLAIVLTLAPMDTGGTRWEELGVISLFVQWVALISAGVLCLLRPWLRKSNDTFAATASYLILISTTTIVSQVTYWTIRWLTVTDLARLDWYSDFLLRNLGISAIVSAVVLRYFYVQHQWAQNLEAKSQARIQALQSRIRPHFLFNSLNTIASLTRTQPAVAEEAIEDLADLFRGTLADTSYEVPIKNERELARRYLHIEKLRMSDRLRVEWHVDNLPDDALIPQLTLQPLLENAIYHGLEHILEGGTIHIHGTLKNGQITITIMNPVPEYTRPSQRTGNRMAQENIKQRLSALYGNKGMLTTTQQGNQYQLTIHFPYTRVRQ
ncbi:MAG: sensor histidine kinase [Gammaproteobacteria bacterium]|nr:sensor histidine kinase [Gammaproteobacteria bacterium]